jgi:hypothetical protein
MRVRVELGVPEQKIRADFAREVDHQHTHGVERPEADKIVSSGVIQSHGRPRLQRDLNDPVAAAQRREHQRQAAHWDGGRAVDDDTPSAVES